MIPSELTRFFEATARSPLNNFHSELRASLRENVRHHGRTEEWDAALAALADESVHARFDQDTVEIGDPQHNHEHLLKKFLPWRKGPLKLGATSIDTEWRSDWKWQRIQPHISSLQDRLILDIGCGNGYHLFRMLGEGAEAAIGIDPTILFNYQFALMQRLAPENSAYLLPLRSEHLPGFSIFDTVFSLGVLYHRRSPLDHLQELFSFLKPGGEMVLETLTIEGDEHSLLIPHDRYAKMSNVWFIPSTQMLEIMLTRLGFRNVRTVDVNITSLEEQRASDWMQFQSLADFLDPTDPTRTIEGYPAPRRATLIANRPD